MSNASKKEQHCIIQWYSLGHQRCQNNFENHNPGSQKIIPAFLSENHHNRFEDWHGHNEGDNTEFGHSSYKINTNLFQYKKIGHETTDIFLYGHSTYRERKPDYAKGNNTTIVRGISVGKHYVSAGKVAGFLNLITYDHMKKNKPMRIWLLSCYSGNYENGDNYTVHLSDKLKKKHGWSNKKIIGFDSPITIDSLAKCRQIAASTNMENEIPMLNLKKIKPMILNI